MSGVRVRIEIGLGEGGILATQCRLSDGWGKVKGTAGRSARSTQTCTQAQWCWSRRRSQSMNICSTGLS
jgi:hypothetical protein